MRKIVEVCMKKTIAIILSIALIFHLAACGNKPDATSVNAVPEITDISSDNSINGTNSDDTTKGSEKDAQIENKPLTDWQQAYRVFIDDSTSYYEDGYNADSIALFDLDKNNVPELIIVYGDGIQGGFIFANVYSYDGDVIVIEQNVDMYYKSFSYSNNPLFNGLFVEGGRNSDFSCDYWTLKDNELIVEPLWVYTLSDEDMVYEELSDNKQLIAEFKTSVELLVIGISLPHI